MDEGKTVDDVDGDGYCIGEDIDGDQQLDCAGDAVPGDCWEGESLASPAALEQLNNGVDDDCDGVVDEGTNSTDDDGDGLSEDAGDCDDTDPDVYPGAEEVLNGVDDNCNDQVDEGLSDFDGDGWSEADGDCDDSDGWVNPGLLEICDDLDNDCDQQVDEDSCDEGGAVVPASGSCGCATSRGGSPVWALGLVVLLRRRVRGTWLP